MEAPPGQAVYDGPNMDYFDVTYIGDQYVSEDEIPYLGDDFVFQHPGVYFTQEDLDNIKANKDNMDTVYGKGYQELVSATTWFDNNTVNPVPVLDVGPYNSPNMEVPNLPAAAARRSITLCGTIWTETEPTEKKRETSSTGGPTN